MTADVVVLGGGPAGLAAAIALAQLGRSAAVVTRGRGVGPQVGETVGPALRGLLESLRIDDFDAVASVPFVGTRSVWGSSEPTERSAILNPLGEGRHLDRAHFDRWLTAHAARSGASVAVVDGPVAVESADSGWRVAGVSCRYLIDARGRAAPGAIPRRWIALDRLVGVVGWLEGSPAVDPDLLIEAAPNGWWYSALQPGGGLVAAYLTDSDLLDSASRRELEALWRRRLAEAPWTAERLGDARLTRALTVRRADSGFSQPDRGARWRAVGDAALARDPLAGAGIASALASGIDAARAADAALAGAPELEGGAAPAAAVFLAERGRYYGRERRWPESLFWMRRRPVDFEGAPITLDPEALLVCEATLPSAEALAPIEALVPPRAVRDLLRALETPTPAHAAVAALRRDGGPLGDRRLVAAVQTMEQAGLVRRVG